MNHIWFLLECSTINGDIAEIERIQQEGRLIKVYPRPGITPSQLIKSLIERGITIEQFQKAATPLEQIFVRVARESGQEAAR